VVRALLLFDFLSSLVFFLSSCGAIICIHPCLRLMSHLFVCCYIRDHMSLVVPVSFAWPNT